MRMMRGSDKQIMWASQILANVISTYESAKALMPSEADRIKTDEAVSMLIGVEYAGDIIDAHGTASFTGDLNNNIGEVMVCNHNTPTNLRSKLLPDIGQQLIRR